MYSGRGRGYPNARDSSYEPEVYDWASSNTRPSGSDRWTEQGRNMTQSSEWPITQNYPAYAPSSSMYPENYSDRYYNSPDPYSRYGEPLPFNVAQPHYPNQMNGYPSGYQDNPSGSYNSSYYVTPPPFPSYHVPEAFSPHNSISRPVSLVNAPPSWGYGKSSSSPAKHKAPTWEDFLAAKEGKTKQNHVPQTPRSPYPHPDVDWQAVEEIDYSKSLSKSQSASSKPRESQYSFSTETSVRPRPRVPSPPPLRPASTRPSPTPSPQTASSTSSHCSSPPRLSAPPPPSLSIPPPLPPKIPDIPKSSLSLNEILPSLQVRKAPPPPSLDQSRKRKRNAVVNEDDNDSSDLIDLLGKKTKSRVSASSRNYARPTRRLDNTERFEASTNVPAEKGQSSLVGTKPTITASPVAVPMESHNQNEDSPGPTGCDNSTAQDEIEDVPEPLLRIRTDIFEEDEDEPMEEGEVDVEGCLELS